MKCGPEMKTSAPHAISAINKMQSIIESYDIPFHDFKVLIQGHNCVVAGDCALQGFLMQEGIRETSEVNTIDIWLYPTPSDACDCSNCIRNKFIKNKGNPMQNFIQFFEFYGFRYSSKPDSPSITSPLIPYVDGILSFTGATGKEIQVFLVLHSNPLHCLQYTFDLSVYYSWWEPFGNQFYTVNPNMTKAMKMYFIDDDITIEQADKRVTNRIEYYKNMGFTLCDGPCEYIRESDTRVIENNSNLYSIIAFDIISFEEYNAVDFLRESEWNILVKCGEKWCAYNRKILTNYMNMRTVAIDIRCSIADTPMNQSVPIEAISAFMKSDYSIYELVYKEDTVFGYNNSIHKSLYNVRCYSVSSWKDGIPLIEFVPRVFSTNNIQEDENDENLIFLQNTYYYQEYDTETLQRYLMNESDIQNIEVSL